jgi:hypothetical protein
MPIKFIILRIRTSNIEKIIIRIMEGIPINPDRYLPKAKATVAADNIPEKIIIQPKINDNYRFLNASSV